MKYSPLESKIAPWKWYLDNDSATRAYCECAGSSLAFPNLRNDRRLFIGILKSSSQQNNSHKLQIIISRGKIISEKSLVHHVIIIYQSDTYISFRPMPVGTWDTLGIKIPKPPYISSLKMVGFVHFSNFLIPSEKYYKLQSCWITL